MYSIFFVPTKVALFISLLLLTACQTTSRELNLDAYLQQFIGQSGDVIQTQLNFNTLGYQTKGYVRNNKQLIYTILKPISIPIAGGHTSLGNNASGGAIVQFGTQSTQHYDVNFSCQVIFQLNNGIAQSIQYQGSAC